MNRSFFNLEIPILQAPIGGASVPELCSAVSKAGGLGGMAFTWTDPLQARSKIRAVKKGTNKPFYVNFALSFEPVSLVASLEEGVPIVTFSWGDPSGWLTDVQRSGSQVGIQVANRDGARRALDLGADFLICQGLEAGGHVQSTTCLATLLPLIVEEAGAIPVVASGGIATSRDIADCLNAGASAVSLGTRFLATVESAAHSAYKDLIAGRGIKETALTICFDGGWEHAPHRVLRNRTLEQWEAAGCPPPGQRPGEGEVVGLSSSGEDIPRYDDAQPLAGTTGSVEEMCLYAGTSCNQVHDIPPAGKLLRRLWQDTVPLLNG